MVCQALEAAKLLPRAIAPPLKILFSGLIDPNYK